LVADQKNSHIVLGGDFNAGDIRWDTNTVAPNSDRRGLYERLLEVLHDHQLEQVQLEPTKESAILDLYCTNRPGLVKSVCVVPGFSDHHMVVIDSSVRVAKKPRRQIRQWSKFKLLSGTLSALKQGYLNRNSSAVVMNSAFRRTTRS